MADSKISSKVQEAFSFDAEKKKLEQKKDRKDAVANVVESRINTLVTQGKVDRAEASKLIDRAKDFDALANNLEQYINDKRKGKEQKKDDDKVKEVEGLLKRLGLSTEDLGILFSAGDKAVEEFVSSLKQQAKELKAEGDSLLKNAEKSEKRASDLQSAMGTIKRSESKWDKSTLMEKMSNNRDLEAIWREFNEEKLHEFYQEAENRSS